MSDYKAKLSSQIYSIRLGSKDSGSKKSSFLNAEMISRLNSNTFPNPPLNSTLVAQSSAPPLKDPASRVIPFEEVDEEEESNMSRNPIVLDNMPDYAEP